MTDEARVIDRVLVRRRESRAHARGAGHFLLDRVADDLADRVAGVARDFPRALDLSPRAGVLGTALAAEGKGREWVFASALGQEGRAFELAADEEWLPFAPGSFDLVVSGLGLHRVNDLPGALIQINRALAPDGLFVASLFGGGTLSELRASLAEAEADLTGGASPRVMPFADVAELGGLMQRAGFALPVADVERVTARYANPFDLFADLREMSETNALHARIRTPLRRQVLARAAEIYSDRFADADGKLRATFDIVTLTGWHPHESQQKPLRPGSAKARLANALRVEEFDAGEKTGPGPRKSDG